MNDKEVAEKMNVKQQSIGMVCKESLTIKAKEDDLLLVKHADHKEIVGVTDVDDRIQIIGVTFSVPKDIFDNLDINDAEITAVVTFNKKSASHIVLEQVEDGDRPMFFAVKGGAK